MHISSRIMSLYALPHELLLGIWEALDPQLEMRALILTCRRFHQTLIDSFYRYAAHQCLELASPWAGAYGRLDMLHRFLAEGADLTHNPKTTPLFTAALFGQDGVVQFLLEKKIDPNLESTHGQRAIDIAAGEGHESIVRFLVEQGADQYPGGHVGSALCAAIKGGCLTNLIELLIHKNQTEPADRRDGDNQAALNVAAETGNVPAPIGVKGEFLSPLKFAIGNNQEEMVRFLLEAGAHRTGVRHGPGALEMAVLYRRPTMVEMLLERGAADATDLLESMRMAPRSRSYDIVKCLLDAGAPPNLPVHLNPPLPTALKGGFDDIALLLAERGAELNTPYDCSLYTPLMLAIRNHNSRLVDMILQSGPDLEGGGSDRCTPLLVAALNGRAELIRTLIKRGANIHRQDSYGRAALNIASERGWVDVVLALPDSDPLQEEGPERAGGASFGTPDKFGRTPLLYAAVNGHETIVAALLAHWMGCVDAPPTTAGRTPRSVVGKWLAEAGGARANTSMSTSQIAVMQRINNMFTGTLDPLEVLSRARQELNTAISSRLKLMQEGIPDAKGLDLCKCEWRCRHCRMVFSEYRERFMCGVCEKGEWEVCPECSHRGPERAWRVCLNTSSFHELQSYHGLSREPVGGSDAADNFKMVTK
ncbi:ankyrin repeat-containing domain protein [Aspergillus pseudoustus]|uniref:Ankyrin repeat-containing domain protein n=1 Tax=Aspergillus pseudoustus TaxID=1810923 RepID=A0ABR4JIH1_9EURO